MALKTMEELEESILDYSSIDLKTFLRIRNEIPKDKLYDMTIEVYKTWGTVNFPIDALLTAKALRPPNYLDKLPTRFKHEDTIRIFRASNTPPKYLDELPEEYSWTIHLKDALWYAQHGTDKRFVYGGEISKKDIIGYTTHAHQVIQYNSVKDVEYLTPNMLRAYTTLYKNDEYRDEVEEEVSDKFMQFMMGKTGFPSYSTEELLSSIL